MNNPYVLPCVGSTGVFEFYSPFDSKIDASEQLTVKAIRTISELESNSVDVLQDRYIKNGLLENDYRDDLEIDMHIVTIQSGYGLWYEIPARYIKNFPRFDGVSYSRRNLVVQLPFIEKSTPLDLLKTSISDIVTNHLGVDNEVAEVEVSTTIQLTDTEHRLTKHKRKQEMLASKPIIIENKELKAANQSLRDKIALLEQYIINNL